MKAGARSPARRTRRAQDGWFPELPPLSRGTSDTSPLVANVVSESSVLATVAGQVTYPQCVVETATPVLDARPSKRTSSPHGGLAFCTWQNYDKTHDNDNAPFAVELARIHPVWSGVASRSNPPSPTHTPAVSCPGATGTTEPNRAPLPRRGAAAGPTD